MSDNEEAVPVFNEEDHQAAYIFNPDDESPKERPSKRRRVTKKRASSSKGGDSVRKSQFVPLMDGKEAEYGVRRREELFEECWSLVEARIKRTLRDANEVTLRDVETFSREAKTACGDKIPSAFILTGPNLASQDLLFEQLQESLLSSTPSKFVRLRSSDATNLKATLRKIIRDITSKSSDEEDDRLVMKNGKLDLKYLNYDLAAVHEFLMAERKAGMACSHVFIAFQDSEAFASELLSELIQYFSNWSSSIPLTLLFGVATSVELLQNRLPKSACEHLYGLQFDVAHGYTALEQTIIEVAVAARDLPLRVGPSLLENMVSRQRDQVAGIQAFISTLKYTYMCHFYANPLSIFMSVTLTEDFDWVQPEHLEGIRSLPSFQKHVEDSLDEGNTEHARSLLEDDTYLLNMVKLWTTGKVLWIARVLRSVAVLVALGISKGGFKRLYIDAMAHGIDLTDDGPQTFVIDTLRKKDPEHIVSSMERVCDALDRDGNEPGPGADRSVCAQLSRLIRESTAVMAEAKESGHALRSKYSGQTRIVRTTVIAQKVQLSQDSATLTEFDKTFTAIVDSFVAILQQEASCEPAADQFLHETWLYDSRAPHRDVLCPKTRTIFQRGLARPGDYLACECCDDEGAISALAPPTSIVYRLYQEAGPLVNVADLWTAFYGIVASDKEKSDVIVDERAALAMFYQGLAELKAMGFVKASKKKTDHILKVKWL
ncbi:related to origin recognition complex subunit 3 [Cephalotrichum gorgonifer]|uniref:Related to origin recognition complex subunit 3 n=1 Tax=Cephalotrichum gorgonifer TaxID=2041049 RepID=A0AAE8STR2_9PEZI|nr:related to origin recognition complex subunit 3 [Cephalotrichum gorgonifer]